ncbi:MAG: hypothetical protein ACOX5G_02320 [Kiritimatiellia bacterium]
MKKLMLALLSLVSASAFAASATVTYQLPADGPLPKTYLVTLAAVDRDNPDWIVASFLCGAPRTVTVENQGRFTEEWDGLDDNYMPVAPGTYGVKGIYTPAGKWDVDNDWHAITARYAVGFSEYFPKPDTPGLWKIGIPFFGDPVNAPLSDVYAAENGIASFYYTYLENGAQTPMFDLNRPVGPEQFLRAFPSGGAGGGPLVCNDGETSWAISGDSCHCIYRSDTRRFGNQRGPYRGGVTLIEGEAVGLDVWRDPSSGESFVYCAIGAKYDGWAVTPERIDTITAYTAFGDKLGECSVDRVRATALRGGVLYAIVADPDDEGACAVAGVPLAAGGLPAGGVWSWSKVFTIPDSIEPARLTVDSSGRFYVSDYAANHVYQLDASGQITRVFGRLDAQVPGSYDPDSLMNPYNLSSWPDADGRDRLLVVEASGPNRVSEWDCDTGERLREFPAYQTKANSGYGADPEDATHVYMHTHNGWITRFRVDYQAGSWTPDAVWPLRWPEGLGPMMYNGLLNKVAVLRANGSLFLAGEASYDVWRLAGDGTAIVPSAALCHRGGDVFAWHDANNDGELQDDELSPLPWPGWICTYHGQKWSGALQLLALGQNGRDGFRLAPSSFDAHGNPVFTQWETVVHDTVFDAIADGTADAVHGGNELADSYNSDWMQMDGNPEDGYVVQARGGPSLNANVGAQYKLSRYVPDGNGGMRMRWRVGRAFFAGSDRGAFVGAMRVFSAMNGIVSVIDQTRSGVALYTDDGLYVDTLFPGDWYREEIGVYRQPGEFFVGTMYPDHDTGKIYYAGGKYTPVLYELENWSLSENPVRTLEAGDFEAAEITLAPSQVADPPEFALNFRGGAGSARVMRFLPALGDVALDGSMTGWESASAATYSSPRGQSIEARCLYNPETLFVRWQVALAGDETFQANPFPEEIGRMFTHDAGNDVVSLYVQGDPDAPVAGDPIGRPGDVRVVCAIFEQDGALVPAALGLYPFWEGAGANPISYHSPVMGAVSFQNVDLVQGAELGCSVADDGRSFVIAAAFPRSAFPAIVHPFSADTRLRMNFSANLGGHNKFWWANVDGSANTETYDEPSEARLYPGSWAPALFGGFADGVPVRQWLCCGPFGGPGCENFVADCPPGMKEQCIALLAPRDFPPDGGNVDRSATYEGELVRGYWGDPGVVRWHVRDIAALDSRVFFGPSAQVWYGAAWIHAPAETTLDAQFLVSLQCTPRWYLNGELVEGLQYVELANNDVTGHATAGARIPITLRKGWNQILGRGFCVGFPPVKLGLRFYGEDELLWPLSFSVNPAEAPKDGNTVVFLN